MRFFIKISPSVYRQGKSVAAERFIRILKTKSNKDMIPVWRKLHIDKLDIVSC